MITLDQGGLGRAHVDVLAPHPLLAGVVQDTTVLYSARAARPGPWRIVPDACGHVLVHRYRDGRSATLVVGARSRYVDVPQSERRFTVGVRLHPGALPELTGLPAWELRDRGAALADLLGASGRALADRVASAAGPREVCLALQIFLARRVSGAHVDWKVRGLMSLLGRADAPQVREAARTLGVGERTLRQTARDLVGLRPKEAARIVRLHRALTLGLAGASDTTAAHASGFADQPHLVRECRSLLGETPRAFRARGRIPHA